jgi:hypothetical protein
MISSLPGGSEIQVVVAGAVTVPLYATWMPAGGPAIESLSGMGAGDGPFELSEALGAAEPWLATARNQPVQIVLLSDLQRIPMSLTTLRETLARLETAGSPQLLIRQVGEPVGGGGVRVVRLPSRAVRPGESVRIAAEVRLEHDDQVFLLELNGRRVAESVATGRAGSVGSVEFAVTAPGPGLHRGLVLKQSDRLPVDDSRPFVLRVWDHVSVLLAHGTDRHPVGRGGWRYLTEALAPSAVEESLFQLREVVTGQLTIGDVNAADVVVLVDPDPLGRQLLGSMLTWLADGGALQLWIGDQTLSGYLTETLLPAFGLPATAEYRRRSEEGRETVTLLAGYHPVFSGLGEDPLTTLSDVLWWRYFALSEGSSQVLLAFDSGAPALLEGRYGHGTIMLLPFHLHLEASGLPLSPMFLPFAQRLTAYLAQQAGGGRIGTLTVGERPQVRLSGSRAARGELDDAAALALIGPDPGDHPVAAELLWRNGAPALVGPVVQRQGFYTFTAGGDTVGVVAAVTPPSEGDPHLDTAEAWRHHLKEAGLEDTADLGRVADGDLASAMRGRDISAWLFVMAFLLLCWELYLARGTGKAVVSP